MVVGEAMGVLEPGGVDVDAGVVQVRLCGLVDSRRQGTFVYDSATSDHDRRVLAEALSHAEHSSGAAAGNDAHRYTVRNQPRPGR